MTIYEDIAIQFLNFLYAVFATKILFLKRLIYTWYM